MNKKNATKEPGRFGPPGGKERRLGTEERLKRFIGTMDEIVFEFDVQGRYLNVWSENENLLKLPRRELLGKRVDEVIPKDLADRVRGIFERVLVTGKSETLEYAMDVPEGERWFLARIALVPAPVGKEPTFSYVGRDITEQKLLEQNLRNSEKRFHDLVETVNDWVWEVDRNGCYTYVNQRVRDLLGYEPHEVLGKTPFDFMPEEEVPRQSAHFADIVAKAQPFSALENINRHKDGHLVILETSGLPFFDGQGHLIGFRGVDRDITSRKAIAEHFRQAKEAAEEATRAKSRFLANMSHEIRTPIAVVLSALEVLEQEDLGEERNQCLQMADRAARALMELLEDILDFSRIEAGRLDLKQEPFDVRRCVDDVLDIFRPKAKQKGLNLTCRVDERLPYVLLGDLPRLRQVLLNLVGNAVKFTRHGGVEVLVEMETSEPSEAGICPVRFSIRDTGIGIAAQTLNRLFESFSQGDNSDTREHGGTGLGLAICKGIVEGMKGRIGAVSTPGLGSTFYFVLPLRCAGGFAEAQDAADPAGLPQALPKKAYRILLGEDDAVLRKLMEALLTKRGWQFAGVEDGYAVVEAWQRGAFDLILMDAQMPKLNGFEATRRIRELEKPSGVRIPIIALTAHAGTESEQRALAAGMDAYLTKPIRMVDLYRKVEHFLEKPAS